MRRRRRSGPLLRLSGVRTASGGARLRHVFNDSFAADLDRVNPFSPTAQSGSALTTQALAAALRNGSGAAPTLFVPQRAFESLARRSIDELRVRTSASSCARSLSFSCLSRRLRRLRVGVA